MANLLYRTTTSATTPGSTSAKGTPLTNVEVDGNFKSLNDELILKAPTANPTFTGSVTIPGGTINNTVIGGTTPAAGTFTSLTATGGSINNATIGASTPSTGAFTTLNASGVVTFSGTSHLKVPTGTEAQRPASPSNGMIRYSTTLDKFEGYKAGAWGALGGGGATGGSDDDVFYENRQTVRYNYTITANKNAMTAGPITINDGVTVTIPDGSSWIIL